SQRHWQRREEAANDSIQCDLRYQGQLEDPESGLYYNVNRYYDADSGQYLSPDPIGFAGGLRPQAYVANPLEWVDPLGLAGCGSKSKYQPEEVLGRKVYKNTEDVFPGKPEFVDSSVHPSIKSKISDGWTNLELMKKGYAPIGPDGKQINLHHVIGKEPGPMVEIVSSTHKKYHKPLHGLIEDGNSFRNNAKLERQYSRFRKSYWETRSLDFL
uniref:HNH/ENDO VII family nuclease n=1 Tax=Salinivibrio socompensis TaxID=1510206 RepID=UPI000470E0DF